MGKSKKIKTKPIEKIMFVGGGSAGHIMPIVALVEALAERSEALLDTVWACCFCRFRWRCRCRWLPPSSTSPVRSRWGALLAAQSIVLTRCSCS